MRGGRGLAGSYEIQDNLGSHHGNGRGGRSLEDTVPCGKFQDRLHSRPSAIWYVLKGCRFIVNPA